MMDSKRSKQEETEAFLRQWTIPEEDRARYTTAKWNGEFRWFKSPNVVCLEQYRRRRRQQSEDGDSGQSYCQMLVTDGIRRQRLELAM
jgi:hypothetical protein